MTILVRIPLSIAFAAMMAASLFGDINAQNTSMMQLNTPLNPPNCSYQIDCAIGLDSTTVDFTGIERITFTNTTAFPIRRLALEWSADSLYKLAMTVDEKPVKIVSPVLESIDKSPVIIELPKVVDVGNSVTIDARFMKTYIKKAEDHRHIMTNWFPRIDWGFQVRDDFEVTLNQPADYTIVTSGVYDNGVYRANDTRRFGIFLDTGITVFEQQVGDVLVRVAHTTEGKDCARLIFETAVDIVDFYQHRFGFFPSNHIEIVPGADAPMGGYPAATSLVVVHGMERMAERDTLHWQWITAHEIGHQYWYEHVLPQSEREFGWLMIGLGIYVDREYIRARDLGNGEHLDLISRYISGVRSGLDTRADVHSDYLETIDFDFNNIVTHGKGYSIISALNCILGDSLFNRIHGLCLKEFTGQRMNWTDFQAVCEHESQQDLDWFFDQWVRSTPYLAYEITSKECLPADTGFITEIMVKRLGTLEMPVPVTATFADSTSQTKFSERRQEITVLQFKSTSPLSNAVIDAKDELAMIIPPPNQEELKIRQYLAHLPSRATIDSISIMVARAKELDISQSLFWGQLGRKLYDWEYYEEALAVFERRAEILENLQSEWRMEAYGWQGLLLDLLNRRDQAISAYKKALAIDTNGDFAYDGDSMVINRAWLTERLETPYRRDMK